MYVAHSGGRIQLFVDHLGLHSTGGNGWTASVRMVDADSGTPATGFDAIVEAKDDSGHTVGPLTLTDDGHGQYSGPFTAAPGKWELAVKAETVPGGPPGIPLRKVYPVVLEPGKDVSVGDRAPGGSGLGMVPIASAVATLAIVGWFVVSRRRRSRVVPARRTSTT